jgi:malate/lactate dehydrogenase
MYSLIPTFFSPASSTILFFCAFEQLNDTIRNVAYKIIKGKGYTSYGVAAAA